MEVKIIADSISKDNCRITTFFLKYPRFIHAEVMAHRMFSRNASSSRAVPVKTIINQDPAMFVHYGAAQKGMQADKEMCDSDIKEFKEDWLKLRDQACLFADKWSKKAHKQMVNRALEPWTNINVLVTATEYKNFFDLRISNAAQPEIHQLAKIMLEKYNESVPKLINPGEYHIPYSDPELPIEIRLKVATARAARVSYLNFEGKIDIEKDIALHDLLLKEQHLSPFEHSAICQESPSWSGNFYGFTQYRKILESKV